jgi:hypothetical protein
MFEQAENICSLLAEHQNDKTQFEASLCLLNRLEPSINNLELQML